jgi:tetratricopeptide (TPR) repeat protein
MSEEPSPASIVGRIEAGPNSRIVVVKELRGDIYIESPKPERLDAGQRAAGADWHQLPGDPENFFGREEFVGSVASAVSEGFTARERARLVHVVEGAGGIGKTAAAIAVGNALKADFPEFQFLLRLGAFSGTPRSCTEVRDALLRRLFPEWQPDKENADLKYQSLFVDDDGNARRGLLVIDDCADDAQLAQLLPGVLCAVIVSSRRALSTGTAHSLSPLDPAGGAGRLLISIYPEIGKGDFAASICRLCGGFPIALRAAAAYLKRSKRTGVGIQTYIEDLKDAPLDALHQDDTFCDPRIVLQYSLKQLDAAALRILQNIAVMADDFDLSAAATVAECSGRALDPLAELHLIEVHPESHRFYWHDLLRALVVEHLPSEDRAVARLRHARYYISVADRACRPYWDGRGDFEDGRRLFEGELAHIRAAMKLLHEEPSSMMERMAMVKALHYRLVRYRFAPEEIVDWYRDMNTEAIAADDLVSSTRAHQALGDIAYLRSEYDKASDYFDIAQQLSRRSKDFQGGAQAHWGLGNLARIAEDYKTARKHYHRTLLLYRKIDHLQGQAHTHWGLGELARLGKSYRSAAMHYRQALALHRQIGSRLGEGEAVRGLGDLARMQGDYVTASKHYEAALLLHREVGDRLGEAHTRSGQGDVAWLQNDHRTSRERYEAALTLYGQIGNRRGMLQTRLKLDHLADAIE